MPLELNKSNSPPMDGLKFQIKHDGWWLIKMKIVLQKLTTTVKTFTKYNDRSRVAAKKKQTDSETQKLANI